jgi:hypothetical protein
MAARPPAAPTSATAATQQAIGGEPGRGHLATGLDRGAAGELRGEVGGLVKDDRQHQHEGEVSRRCFERVNQSSSGERARSLHPRKQLVDNIERESKREEHEPGQHNRAHDEGQPGVEELGRRLEHQSEDRHGADRQREGQNDLGQQRHEGAEEQKDDGAEREHDGRDDEIESQHPGVLPYLFKQVVAAIVCSVERPEHGRRSGIVEVGSGQKDGGHAVLQAVGGRKHDAHVERTAECDAQDERHLDHLPAEDRHRFLDFAANDGIAVVDDVDGEPN